MELFLDRIDLKPKHENIESSLTRFEHFKPEVQEAIKIVGRATFKNFDGSNYNAIYPPKKKLKKC
jgi:hypothetical protein